MGLLTDTERLIRAVADAVDVQSPGLRERNLDEWLAIVAWRCYQQDATIGRKRASATRPISKDSLGILQPAEGAGRFIAVSIARDDEIGGNKRRWIDYGLVSAEQVWVRPERPASEPRSSAPAPAPQPPAAPAPPPQPPDHLTPADVVALAQVLNGLVQALAAHREAIEAHTRTLEKVAADGVKVRVG